MTIDDAIREGVRKADAEDLTEDHAASLINKCPGKKWGAGGKVSAKKTSKQEVPFAVRNWQSLPDETRVDVKVVAVMLGRSIPSIWRDVAAGRLPQPVRITPRCSRWQVGTLRKYLRGDMLLPANV